MHTFKRTPKDSAFEPLAELSAIDADVDHIIRRANKDSREFVVETVNNIFEWRTMPIDLPIVKEFLEQQTAMR